LNEDIEGLWKDSVRIMRGFWKELAEVLPQGWGIVKRCGFVTIFIDYERII